MPTISPTLLHWTFYHPVYIKKEEAEFQLLLLYPDPVQATEIIGKQKNLSFLLSTICIFLIFSIFAIFCPFFVIKYTFSTL